MTDCTQGQNECKYILKTSMVVVDAETGKEVDKTEHVLGWAMTYPAMMAIKYLQLKKFAEAGATSFIKVLEASGDAVKALKDD